MTTEKKEVKPLSLNNADKTKVAKLFPFWFRIEKLLGHAISYDKICSLKEKMEALENENKTPKL